MSVGERGLGLAAGTREAIEALVVEHSWLIDHGQADELATLFTADGRMLGVGADLVGRDAIAAWGVTRAAMRDRKSRHVCTNLRLVPVTDDEVHGTVVITVLRHDGAGPGGTTPLLVGDYQDVYRRDSDGAWRFAERRIVALFGGA